MLIEVIGSKETGKDNVGRAQDKSVRYEKCLVTEN